MIVDTSALIAILFEEDDAHRYLSAIEETERPAISAVSLLEAGIVVTRRTAPEALLDLMEFLDAANFEVAPFTAQQAQTALHAYRRFGRGLHAAGLNFGDCAAYALAAERDDTLLFKGTDFAQTDIRCALE